MGKKMLSTRLLTRRAYAGLQMAFKRSLASEVNSDNELIVEYLEEEDKGIVVLGFDRPKAMNALSKNLVKEFTEVIDAVKFDKDVRVIILRSHVKGAFCAGADLKEQRSCRDRCVGPAADASDCRLGRRC